MKVEDVNIDDDYIVVTSSDTILEVSKLIAKEGIPDAIVVDTENKVLGVLDDYDIISKVIAQEKDVSKTHAEDIMFAPPRVHLDTDLDKVHQIMEELEATVLPVVDTDNELIGVITIMDVLEGKVMDDRSIIDKILGR